MLMFKVYTYVPSALLVRLHALAGPQLYIGGYIATVVMDARILKLLLRKAYIHNFFFFLLAQNLFI